MYATIDRELNRTELPMLMSVSATPTQLMLEDPM